MRNVLIISVLLTVVYTAWAQPTAGEVIAFVEDYVAADDSWSEPAVEIEMKLGIDGGDYLVPVTLTEGWYSDMLVLYLVREGAGYRLADLNDGLVSTVLSGSEVRIFALIDFERPLYVLEFGEASYGSGFGGEYGFYNALYIEGGELKTALRDATRVLDVGYSRWYGGFASTAWQDGYYYEEKNEIAWDDLDGDGWPEALVVRKSRKEYEDDFAFSGANLYSVKGTAEPWGANFLYDEEMLYKEVTDGGFDSALEARGDDVAYAILYEERLWYDGDVPAALEMLEKVKLLTDDTEIAAGCDATAANISTYANDPPEAVRLFYAQAYDRVREEYADTGVWTEVRFLSYDAGDCLWCVENFPDDPRWGVRVQCYVLDGLIGDEGTDLVTAEKHVKELLKGDFEAGEKAQTCVYLADWYVQEGDFKKARKYYETAYDVDPGGVFSDYAASRMVEYYDPVADAEKRLAWMLKTVKWDNYGWWQADVEDELEGISYVNAGDGTVPIRDLNVNGEAAVVWFKSGDFDGDGELELEANANFRDAGRRSIYIFERERDRLTHTYVDEHELVGVVTIEEVFAGRPAVIYGAETTEGGVDIRFRRILSYVDGEYRIVGDIRTAETDAVF